MSDPKLNVSDIVFVDDLSGEVRGELLAIWADSEGVDTIPADGGPIADAIEKLCPAGCHVEIFRRSDRCAVKN